MSLNCNDTKFSVIDVDGVLTVLDLETVSSNIFRNQEMVVSNQRKDCFGIYWSKDEPNLYVVMEKTRMYVFRNSDPEVPVRSPPLLVVSIQFALHFLPYI